MICMQAREMGRTVQPRQWICSKSIIFG